MKLKRWDESSVGLPTCRPDKSTVATHLGTAKCMQVVHALQIAAQPIDQQRHAQGLTKTSALPRSAQQDTICRLANRDMPPVAIGSSIVGFRGDQCQCSRDQFQCEFALATESCLGQNKKQSRQPPHCG